MHLSPHDGIMKIGGSSGKIQRSDCESEVTEYSLAACPIVPENHFAMEADLKSVEVIFAQKLACGEPVTRQRAFRTLQDWIKQQSAVRRGLTYWIRA
ncbi:hypothetical protein GCK32_014094 [Trichostrongylus colubriformis]|uniref:Uncharacterized protein n=1 Tax=Trichostrongylus colubriformis TaxID=6319 RepID=A0AAN8FAE6_TRICO